MAGRPKKTATVKETVENTQEQLLKELQEQLAQLKAENEQLKKNKVVEENEDEELTSDTDILVISQTVGTLVISTDGNGSGTVYRFEKFGDVQDIPFGDLKDIVKNKPRFAREGAYYIAHEKAVKKLRLGTQYKDIIDSKTFDNLFNLDAKAIVSLYESAPHMQQEQIISMIEDRIDNKLEVDGNVLLKIGALCGKDFMSRLD